MRRCRAAVLSLVVLVVLVSAPLALAGTPGHWTRLTDSTAATIDEVTLARTGDGVLHVAWSRPTPGSSGRDLLEVPVSTAGQAATRVVLASNWATIENPFLVPTGGPGLDVFVGAVRTINAGETVSNLAMFTSADGGQSWALDPLDLTSTGAAYSNDVAAALSADGTPFESWGSSSCLCVHKGVSASTGNVDFQQGLGDFGYEPGMAFDPATNRLVVAWYSNGTGHAGIYAAQVDQSTGAAASSQQAMPGTGNLLDGPFGGRTPLVARPGGGLYVAYEGGYPRHTKVLLWRVGSGSSLVLAQNPGGVQSVGIASTPSGRLWVFWSARSQNGSPIIYARRSNPQATVWGATVAVGPPPHAATSWNLVGNGQATRLDLVGSFSLGNSSSASSWHTQVLPGLSLRASLTRLHAHAKHAQKLTFYVSDAGAPVGGATVRVGNVKGKTNSKGVVKLAIGPFTHAGRIDARASLNGYVGATVMLSIK